MATDVMGQAKCCHMAMHEHDARGCTCGLGRARVCARACIDGI